MLWSGVEACVSSLFKRIVKIFGKDYPDGAAVRYIDEGAKSRPMHVSTGLPLRSLCNSQVSAFPKVKGTYHNYGAGVALELLFGCV